MLDHGMHRWLQAIKLDLEGLSLVMEQSGVKIKVELCNEHPLFCSVCTLNYNLQSGPGMIPKWNPQSNAGMYHGHSPEHASTVTLVLN